MAEAAAGGAQMLLFAEYAGLSLASLCTPEERADVQHYLPAIQPWLPAYLDLHSALARQHGVYIVAGSVPLRLPDGSYRNRAWFCRPDGSYDFQDKLIMTRFEAEVWGIEPGREVKVFDTVHGRVAINICYDVEFPLIARLQAETGARLILAASWTESLAGHHRVKVGCRAGVGESVLRGAGGDRRAVAVAGRLRGGHRRRRRLRPARSLLPGKRHSDRKPARCAGLALC